MGVKKKKGGGGSRYKQTLKCIFCSAPSSSLVFFVLVPLCVFFFSFAFQRRKIRNKPIDLMRIAAPGKKQKTLVFKSAVFTSTSLEGNKNDTTDRTALKCWQYLYMTTAVAKTTRFIVLSTHINSFHCVVLTSLSKAENETWDLKKKEVLFSEFYSFVTWFFFF